MTFLELVNIGDLIQQMADVFYEQELVAQKLTDKNDFLNPAAVEKKRFEKMLDEMVAAGLDRGIDVLMTEVDWLFATTQQSTDFNPGAISIPGAAGFGGGSGSGGGGGSHGPTRPFSMNFVNTFKGSSQSSAEQQEAHEKANKMSMSVPPIRDFDTAPTKTAQRIVETVASHTALLNGMADKNVLDVFNHEVGLRLFASLCKHIKRQRISVDGAVKLIRYLLPAVYLLLLFIPTNKHINYL